MLRDKYSIRTLPLTPDFLPEKRFKQEKGEIALILDNRDIRHLTYFSLLPGAGRTRGGHYHRQKSEHTYLIRGKLRIELNDTETKESEVIHLDEGQELTVHAGCAHLFMADEEAQVLEYYNCAYDKKDDILFKAFSSTTRQEV